MVASDITKGIARCLKAARMSKGASMQDCADAIGVETVTSYYRKEIGMRKLSLEEAIKLAKYLGMTLDELFGGVFEQ